MFYAELIGGICGKFHCFSCLCVAYICAVACPVVVGAVINIIIFGTAESRIYVNSLDCGDAVVAVLYEQLLICRTAVCRKGIAVYLLCVRGKHKVHLDLGIFLSEAFHSGKVFRYAFLIVIAFSPRLHHSAVLGEYSLYLFFAEQSVEIVHKAYPLFTHYYSVRKVIFKLSHKRFVGYGVEIELRHFFKVAVFIFAERIFGKLCA